MKKLSLILIVTIISLSSAHSQLSTDFNFNKYYPDFLKTTTYYVESGDAGLDSAVINVLSEEWKLTPFEKISKESFKKKKTDKKSSYLLFYQSTMFPKEVQNFRALIFISEDYKDLIWPMDEDLMAYAPLNYSVGESHFADCRYRVRNMIESMLHVMDYRLKNVIKNRAAFITNKLLENYNTHSVNIKNRTLLICKDQISSKSNKGESKAITEEQFAVIYHHKFQFVDQAFLEKVIREKNTEYYYLQMCLGGGTAVSNGVVFGANIFIFDPSNGEVIYGANNTAMEINEKDVKYLSKMVEGQ
jgi:hypothetical protein